jgi:predicted ATPase/DNA-binding winged helix-turn-helix (wHTH) protein
MPVTDDSSVENREVAFGPYRLNPAQQLLLRNGVPLEVSSREWDILVALVERAGEVLNKGDLMLRVWRGNVVEEATLRVHISNLRKILEQGKGGMRYIESVSRHGYRFSAPVSLVSETPGTNTSLLSHGIPRPPQRMIGRDEVLARLVARLPCRRFMTIAGPGGVGKTTLALAAIHCLAPGHFADIHFVELGSIVPSTSVPAAIAGALGLETVSADPVMDILAHIGQRRVLLVFDNCERIVEEMAFVTERLLGFAPGLHILATSREPLRAQGESVVRLKPLELPPRSARLTLAEALAFPAVNLFIQCVGERRDGFAIGDEDVPAIVEICRQLDGLPLSIELAAARTDVYAARALASQLRDRLKFLTRGPRTAAPRHRTLRATLDWSHETLTTAEQVALRRLAVFDGPFDVESAGALIAGDGIEAAEVLDLLASLRDKSLLDSRVSGETVRFHMLQTCRDYALDKLDAAGEGTLIRRRHAFLCDRAGFPGQ